MAQQTNTELGASIAELTSGAAAVADNCPECGEVVPEAKQHAADDGRTAAGRSSGEVAECVVVECCCQYVVPTSEGLEAVDLEKGFN